MCFFTIVFAFVVCDQYFTVLYLRVGKLQSRSLQRFEGRGWPTDFRGRLWIASTSAEVDPMDVEELEEEYRALYGTKRKEVVV